MKLIKKIDKEDSSYRLTRRWRPHYERYGGSYFCTTRASYGRIFSEQERDLILDSVHFLAKRQYQLFATVVMPDHLHVLLQPFGDSKENSVNLSTIFHSLKSYTAHQMLSGSLGHVWQPERDDRLIRSQREFYYYKNYIIENPVTAGFVTKPSEYRWLWTDEENGI